LEAAAHLCFL
jgi:hypothetical protein